MLAMKQKLNEECPEDDLKTSHYPHAVMLGLGRVRTVA